MTSLLGSMPALIPSKARSKAQTEETVHMKSCIAGAPKNSVNTK